MPTLSHVQAQEWVRIPKNLHQYPKVLMAAEDMNVSIPATIGHLVMLWDWSREFAPNGDITDIPNWMIERVAGWTGEVDAMFGALVRADLVYEDEEDHTVMLCDFESLA